MRGDSIEYFMWGFQRHFRINVESAVEHTLEELGVPAEPIVFLIGILEPAGSRQPICIEPEDGPLAPADFREIETRAAELYRLNPDSQMRRSDRRHHELIQEGNRRLAEGSAIAEVLTGHLGDDVQFFVGLPTLVEEHHVYTAIGIPRKLGYGGPRLNATEVPGHHWFGVTPSLVEGAMLALVVSCSRALLQPDPGDGLGIGVEPPDTARSAARSLMDTVVALAGNESRPPLFDALNRASTTLYEQRLGVGRVIVAAPRSPDIVRALLLDAPVPIGETRAVRKLLELSRDGDALLTDGAEVYGLGHVHDEYKLESESVFEVVVVGHGSWELLHAGTPLMSVQNGAARFPAPPLGSDRFNDITQRVFATTGCDVDALWSLAQAASEAEHGTMLVVSERADLEAQRLKGQALVVDPVPLDAAMVRQVTGIDSAVLVDPHGTCHAIGVILDGTATGEGDRSRGARFNSAVRYLSSASAATVIILVSEDGMINLLPDLRPRMSRSALAALMRDLREAAALEPVDPERFYKALNRVKAAKFYLSSAQCGEANRLSKEHWDRRRAAGAQLWITEPDLVPSPDMSEAYLTD